MKHKTKSVRVLALTLIICLAVPLAAADPVEEVEGLPNYYQFFMKEGGQVVIEAERERDEQIEAGVVAPVTVGEPLKDFSLPDGFGNVIGLRDFVGKKNVVLVTFRTWW